MEKAKAPELRFQKDDNGQSFPDWEKKKFSMLYKKSTEKNDGSIGIDKNITVATMQFKPDIGVSKKDYLKTYNTFNVGDIAFEGHHSKEFKFGRFVENDIGNGIVSHIFSVFRPIAPYDLQFWKYAIHSEKVMQRTLSRTTKASTMMHDLVTKDFLKESILVPSLREQKKIGDFLLTLDRRITIADKKLTTLQAIKKGMLQKIFSQELRFKNDDGNEFPAWENRSMKTGMFIKSRIGWQRLTHEEYKETGDYYLITGTDIRENNSIDLTTCWYVSKERFEKDKNIQVKENDIIVTKDGTIGKIGIISGLDKPATLNSHLFLVRNIDGEVENRFVFYVLSAPQFSKYVERGKTGGTLTGLTQKAFEAFEYQYPSLPEQRKIISYFTTLDRSIDAAQKKAAALRTIKKGLLQKMFI